MAILVTDCSRYQQKYQQAETRGTRWQKISQQAPRQQARPMPFWSPQAPRPESNPAPTRIPIGSPKLDIARSRERLVMRSLYTLPHDAERDTYLVLNDFGASRLRLARPTLKAPAATTTPAASARSPRPCLTMRARRQPESRKPPCASVWRLRDSGNEIMTAGSCHG